MEWYHVENATLIEPAEVDTLSSKKYNYLRKNITLIEGTLERSTHYEWDECKIEKSVWDLALGYINHEDALTDVYDALTELAGLIVGG